jgi:hypothetical protein
MPWCPECGVEYREGFKRCSECQVELLAAMPPEASEVELEWQEVGIFPTHEAAELARGYLENAGITAEVRDPDPAHHEVLPVAGHVALVVTSGDVAAARQWLDSAEHGEATVSETSDPEPGSPT